MKSVPRRTLCLVMLLFSLPAAADPAALRQLAHDYYQWRDAAYPVATSAAGDHRLDDRFADYRAPAVAQRRQHVSDLMTQLNAMSTSGWGRDDRIDLVLFRAQLEYADFFDRRLDPESTDPQLYVSECSNGVFTLLQKEYASNAQRARAATARLRQVPALLQTARTKLRRPVKLYASLAIDAIRGGDDLYRTSLETLTHGISAGERRRLFAARDTALKSLHEFADWLSAALPSMPEWRPMGAAAYADLLKKVLLLPLDARDVAQLGEIELPRSRALEAMLKDPKMASPDPSRAARVPRDQAEFLAAYESRLREITDHLQANRPSAAPSEKRWPLRPCALLAGELLKRLALSTTASKKGPAQRFAAGHSGQFRGQPLPARSARGLGLSCPDSDVLSFSRIEMSQ